MEDETQAKQKQYDSNRRIQPFLLRSCELKRDQSCSWTLGELCVRFCLRIYLHIIK